MVESSNHRFDIPVNLFLFNVLKNLLLQVIVNILLSTVIMQPAHDMLIDRILIGTQSLFNVCEIELKLLLVLYRLCGRNAILLYLFYLQILPVFYFFSGFILTT